MTRWGATASESEYKCQDANRCACHTLASVFFFRATHVSSVLRVVLKKVSSYMDGGQHALSSSFHLLFCTRSECFAELKAAQSLFVAQH